MVLYLHSPIAKGSFTFAHLYSPVDYVYQTQQSKMVLCLCSFSPLLKLQVPPKLARRDILCALVS